MKWRRAHERFKMMAYDELSSKFLEEFKDLEEDLARRVQKVEVLKVQVHLLETLIRKPHASHAVIRVLENELELIRATLKD